MAIGRADALPGGSGVKAWLRRLYARRIRSREASWRALDRERVAKIAELMALDAERLAMIERLEEERAGWHDALSVRRTLALIERNETMATRDAERVAKIEQLMALDADRVEKIGELVALDAQRVAQLSELNARLAMDRPLVFMHIPKTAGTALVHGLRDVLPSAPYIGGFDLSMFGAIEKLEALHPSIQAVTYPDGLPAGDGADLVAGHFAYSTLTNGRPNARSMTVLREARSRLLSLWMYWRSLSGEHGVVWTRRLAQQPVADFLNLPDAACQTDNVTVRMLLWPHPRIAQDSFIDPADDERLLEQAIARLQAFDLADVIENPTFQDNVSNLLARRFTYARVKEMTHMPPELRVPLHAELGRETLRLIEHRTRLDRQLWTALVRERMPGLDAGALADDTFRKTLARYGEVMAA